MRKMIFTLLLLIVPALANAWTLTVKVAGVASAQPATPVTVAYQTSGGVATTTNLKIGTNYVYPAAAITVAAPAGPGGVPTVLLNGAASSIAAVNALTTGPKTVTITYATPAVAYNSVTVAQATGGVIYAKALNNTWSTSTVSGYLQDALVPVSITADNNYKITGYTDGATPVTVAGLKQVTFDALAAGQVITPVFALDAKNTASLFIPTNTVAGATVTASVVATTNDTGLLYTFTFNGVAGAASASSSATFTAIQGVNTVSVKVTSAHDATGVTVSGTVTGANAIVAANSECTSCHSTQSPTIVANYNASIHSQSTHSACAACHTAATPHSANINKLNIDPATFVTTAAVPGPYGTVAAGKVFCTGCHAGQYAAPHDLTTNGTDLGKTCAACHTSSDAHGITAEPVVVDGATGCINCHSFAQKAMDGKVNDNNGVRSITQEFAKWSHHVTGVSLQDAHCAACHLEGKVVAGKVVVDSTKHMADAQTHLRNADTDADMQWDPAAPNHTTMDNFCMSCHDANGATSAQSALIRATMVAAPGKTASALNPFADTISNRYDKMQRPAVVDASSQFDTANNSHHAVKGSRYATRTRIANASDPRAMTAAQSVAFAANSSATLKGKRSTMYDAKVLLVASGAFTSVLNQLYVPLENAAGETYPRTGSDTLGDDSTLHCGDCHTVGQWKANSSTTASGAPTPAAIGAHGSNNEYLLRNSIGTDARHTQNAYTIASNVVTFTNPNGAFLVCYNCHTYAQYGSVYNATGIVGPHAGEYDQAGRCDGVGNTLPFNGYTTGTATDGTQFASRFEGPITKYSAAATYAGEQNPDFGNIFGIQCLNCHNSGLGNAYGGIHGSAKDTITTTATPAAILTAAGVTTTKKGYYVDGMGNANKVERFLPGLGDAMHVPGTLGGFTGGTTVGTPAYITGGVSSDTNWEQKHWQQTASTTFGPTGTGPVAGTLTSAGAGCYTLSESATAATATLEGPSVTGVGGPATEGIGIWGGCDDHGAAQGKGDHGFIKRIVRPVTY